MSRRESQLSDQQHEPSHRPSRRITRALLRVVLSVACFWLAACDLDLAERVPPPMDTDGIGTSPSIGGGVISPQQPAPVLPPFLAAPMALRPDCAVAMPLLYGVPAPSLEQGTLASCVDASSTHAAR